ncbi:MAG: DUF4835 family protein [Bacteroidales bacterium]|nr:DUF4835 family protein [Bacteroidales bacterium]
MKRLFALLILFIAVSTLSAQDFQCNVSINSSKISGSNRERYNSLQQEVYNFINERKWCQYNLKTNERIECGIMINLTEVSGDVLKGTMTVQLQRPVFKSNYKTTVLNFQDNKIQFTYEEGQPLEYSDGVNLNQFTSLIAYYLNLFLALDFDTFSMNGGAPYLDKCQSIVSLNQSSAEQGWQSFESGQNNRYWIVENLTNGTYSKLHEFLYNYHRLGLDVMVDNPDQGRAAIFESLKTLQQVYKQKSNLVMVRYLVSAKSDEIINIFKEGLANEKTQVVNIMKQLDPSNSSKYDAITASTK